MVENLVSKLEHNLIHDHLENSAKVIALVDENLQYNYQELWDRIVNFANFLTLRKISSGDRVAIILQNSANFIIAYFACSIIGAIKIPIDYNLRQKDVQFILEDSEAKMLIVQSARIPQLQEIINEQKFVKNIIVSQSTRNNYAFGSKLVDNFDKINTKNKLNSNFNLIKETDPAIIVYTTGTTGRKKGAVLSHQKVIKAAESINEFLGLNSAETELLIMPLSRSFGLARLRCILLVGGTVIVLPGLSKINRVLKCLQEWNVTVLGSVPSGFQLLLGRYKEIFKSAGSSLKFIEIGSAPMPVNKRQELMNLLPNTRICMHYGLTEASRATFISFRDSFDNLQSIGKPSPNVEIQLITDKGTEADYNEIGEIQIKCPWIVDYYWRAPELTQKSFNGEWFRSGDRGYKSEDGYFYFVGRADDMINIGGFKVSPIEIEKVINSHPSIVESAVVGITDDDSLIGQRIHAFIVLDTNQEPVEAQEIKEYCEKFLEIKKIPSNFKFVKSILRTDSGKIQRHLLRQN